MKKRSNRGVSRAVAILLVLIAVMLVIIAVPGWKVFRYRSEKTGCEQAMKSASDGLIIEYLNRWDEGSTEEAMRTLDNVMVARPNICPAGGNVYLVRRDDGIFEPVCGLHDSDKKQRVRLNASCAKDLLAEALRKTRKDTGTEPESVEITLNGKPLECVRVPEVLNLRWGTKSTRDYEGTVAYYGIAGNGSFTAKDVEPGEICYFVYADEYHCASWRADDGWTGDAYRN